MKAVFLLAWRQWRRGGARTWFVAASALLCSTILAAVQFGGASLAAAFKLESRFALFVQASALAVELALALFLAVLLRGAFAMSLAQRTRMLGQLASVGATRRQLRQSVWLDAALLSAFSAPLGVLCAAGGLAVTFRLLRPFLQALERNGVQPVRLLITPAGAALALAVPVATLLLAATGTARRAARLTPIEAVRGAAETPPRSVRRREPRQAEALLASRSTRRAGGRFRTQVSAILVCTLLIFMAGGFSCGLLAGYDATAPTYTYRVYLWARNIDTAALLAGLHQAAGQAAGGAASWSNERTDIRVPAGQGGFVALITLDDASFERWYGGPLDQPGSGLACVYSPPAGGAAAFAGGEQPGETLPGQPITVADVCVQPLPAGVMWRDNYVDLYPAGLLVAPQSALDRLRGTALTGDEKREFEFYVDAQDSSLLTPALEQALAGLGASAYAPGQTNTGWRIDDQTPNSPSRVYQRAATVLLRVFAGGFAALISLGCAASLLGSIGAETQLRRREFALLRSAGMTLAQLAGMLRQETLLRCGWGLGLGLPLGAALWLALARTLMGGLAFGKASAALFAAPLACAAAVSLGVLLVCLLAERAAFRAAKGASIRDDLMRE